jgi:hypothetical protein
MRKLLLLAFACSTAASAAVAAPAGVSLSQDKRLVIVTHPGTMKFTPPLAHRPKTPAIYSTLGTAYPKGPYWAFEGYTISGPTSPIGEQIWIAAAFTPSATATVSEIDAAVGFVEGTNGVVISLYADASGVPGKTLWTGKASSLTTFGDCCAIAALKVKGSISVTAGTQYWVVVTTDAKETGTWAAWNETDVDQVDSTTIAVNEGSGWSASSALPGVAFGVYGK